MNLYTYFLVSVSVFCTLGILILIIMIVSGLIIRSKIARLLKKIDSIADSAVTVSTEVKNFTLVTLESFEKFKANILTFEFFQRIIVAIVELFQGRSKGKR